MLRRKSLINVLKFLFTALLIVEVALRTDHQRRYLLVGWLSLFWTTALSWMLVRKHKHWGRIINNVASLILNAQYVIFLLGGSFLSMDMLFSLHTVSALSGAAGEYIMWAMLVVIVSFLPIFPVRLRPVPLNILAACALVGNVALYTLIGPAYSAFGSLGILGSKVVVQYEEHERIKKLTDTLSQEKTTYSKAVDHGYKYPGNKKPNVILIFTEGMSQSIVDDPRDITPNIRKYENNSLFFTNYYNHTSATYRGIPCELHSGFQFNDMDDNHLTGLQDVFHNNGYDTTLINPEPNQKDFAAHMGRFGFDHYVNGLGGDNVVTDKQMYNEVFRELEQNDASGKPKLIAFYTFGTHVGQDSPDQKFGDGSDKVLNRFHNLDYQFGQFMDKLQASEHANDTMVVFTTDHCSYADADYTHAFPDIHRAHIFIDQIPMLFWYTGVKPVKFDCQDRTSLDMAPTVLDFLNMDAPSDFLGTSLFAGMPKDKYQQWLETTYVQPISDGYWTTANGKVHPQSERAEEYVQRVVTEYCARATKQN